VNQQRRLTYMKALGIPIWLSRTDLPHNTDTEAYTEQTAATTLVINTPPMAEHDLSYDDQMAMQEYEQTAQYDTDLQISSADFAQSLIESLDTTTTSPPQSSSPQNESHHITATTTAQLSEGTPTQSQSLDIPSTQIQTQPLPAIEVGEMGQSKHNLPSEDIPLAALNWQDLQQVVKQCQFCEMAKFRSNTVFGSGNAQAKWLFIGEAPDVEDDQQGLPFLAKSGQLLDNILAAINLDRNAVYLTNILKCRPPNDRDPHVDEAKQCMGYLYRQIELIQPKVIVVVGRVATRNLLNIKKPLGQMRGYVHYLEKPRIPVVVTYHPRYLLRQPSAKRKLWEDIQLAQSVVQAAP